MGDIVSKNNDTQGAGGLAEATQKMHKEFRKGMVYAEIGRMLCMRPFKTDETSMYIDESGVPLEYQYAGGLLTEEELAIWNAKIGELREIEEEGE